jgi:valyl-tRNA synthetase
MEPRYDIKEIEARIYAAWEKSGFFNPDVCVERGVTNDQAEAFSLVLPPPNVTGTLHIGHAFEHSIQDAVIRYERMRGKRTLWIPGTDHAAIATQSKVEKELAKEEVAVNDAYGNAVVDANGKTKTRKLTKHDLGREEFLRRVEAFAQESHDTIVRQVKRLGASLDWSREAYTLDAARSLAVRTAFKKMYDLGLIYRGDRIVNWDPALETTVSDDEIEWKEETVPFYYLKYGPFTIGTARPETKFGDKYVVMHPDDKRYEKYKDGQKIELEWINGPITATVIKDKAIDMEFGTGVMTITPWHDAVDFDIAERHHLDMEQVIDLHGKLLPIAGEFAGMHIKKARVAIVEKLQSKGLIEKIDEKYAHRIATNSRGNGIIEPQILKQWFIGVNKKFKPINGGPETTLKEIMRRAVESGGVKILPERFERVYYNWIDNLRDWCISRQIWFGHRIPVWYCLHCGEPQVNMEIKSKWFLVRHGETDYNKEGRSQGQTDTPLNDTGRAQAHETARKLKNENIDLIISSDLSRARETAEIIARETGAEIIFDEKFRERSFGEGEGMLAQEQNEKYGDRFHTYDQTYPGGETFKEVEERVVEAFRSHGENYFHKNVVIATHGGVIRALKKNIKNISVEDLFNETNKKATPNAAIITLEIGSPCSNCGHDFYEQDPDTLDTWFSSGLWPFSTLGWPDTDAPDFKTYFPNSFMAPGYEILFFWVARMILMSGALLGEVPFRTVYIHGIVRDAKGEKFSKSKGNGIDPVELADKYGADALRMGLIVGAAPGNDVKFDEQRVKGYRNFATKIWNIARFIEMSRPAGGAGETTDENATAAHTPLEHKYIKELAALKNEIMAHFDAYEFHLAAEKIYHYIWHTLADKIIEAEKLRLRDGSLEEKATSYALLESLLLESLKMLHPFMPYITEAVYQIFRPGKMLMVEQW